MAKPRPVGEDFAYFILALASLSSVLASCKRLPMTLTLAMLRCPDNVAPETRSVAGGEFSIGRGPENDWVLPDPERGLSKQHCLFAFRAGGWQVADLSTNGTFLNREAIGRGQVRDLRDGDRLSFGAYEIEVDIADAAASRRPAGGDPFAARRSAAPELFALDPFATPAGRAEAGLAPDPLLGGAPGADPFAPALAPGGINLPADFDPLAPDPGDRDLRGPVQSDHTPHIEDAFSPPAARSVLPDDWDRDVGSPGLAPPRAAPAEPLPPASFVPQPQPAPLPRQGQPPATAAAAPVAAPAAAPAAMPAAGVGPATAAPAPRAQPVAPPAAAPQSDLLAAFLRGCGSADFHPADPVAAMEALGAAFRAFVAGLRQAMIARAAVKGEFRIEQTMIRSRGNNPLKFSADDDDAMAALLGVGRRSDMGVAEAVGDALRDIRMHELATVAAMQAAVRALLAEFAPARLRQAAEHGGLALLSAQRKAAAWDAFEALHARISQALLDDFDSVFGKAFARAYERAIGEISTREPDAP
jgi:type VI secretion system protein ImpI/type VI secretion system protein